MEAPQRDVDDDSGTIVATPTASLRKNSVARLMSQGARLVVGLGTALITARWLGPAGKGTLSSLLFISGLLTYACSLGLGEAAIVLKGRRREALQEAVSTALIPIAATSLVGIGGLWGAAAVAQWSGIGDAVAVISVFIPIATVVYVLTAIETSMERLVFTSIVAVVQIVVDLFGLVVFVVLLDLGVLGGALAALVASGSSLTMLAWSLKGLGFSFRPRLHRAYLKAALKFGALNESAFLLVALSQRVDLLVVYALAGEAEAGRYAIALTIAPITYYAAGAVTGAAFPRVAHIPDHQVPFLLARLVRMTLTVSLISSVVLLVVTPYAVPFAFGSNFRPSVVPTLIMLPGAVLWSQQWALTRTATARGHSHIYLLSFGISLAAIIAVDLVAVPALGIKGAAIGSLAGPLCGLIVCLTFLRNRGLLPPWKDLVPRRADLTDLLHLMRAIWRRLVPNGRTA